MVTKYATWIPVMFALIAPVSFTAFAMLQKNISEERIGFDPITLSFSSYAVVNFIILAVGIPYWM